MSKNNQSSQPWSLKKKYARTLCRLFKLTSLCYSVLAILLMMTKFSRCQSSPNNTYTVGILVSLTGRRPMRKGIERAAEYVFKQLNEQSAVSGYRLRYELRDTDCDVGKGLNEMMELVMQANASAIVGPTCESVCQTGGLLARRLNMAMVSFGCQSTLLSDPVLFPTFARTTGTFLETGLFIKSVLKHFGWVKGVSIVTNIYSAVVWLEMVDELARHLDPGRISWKHWPVDLKNVPVFLEELKKQKSYVFVLFMYPETTFEFLSLLKEENYFKKDYVYIAIDFVNFAKRLNWTTDFTGLLDITVDVSPQSPNFTAFLNHIFDEEKVDSDGCLHYEYGLHAALMADAIYVLVEGLKQAQNIFIGKQIVGSVRKTNFTGVTGEVYINDDGSRFSNLMLHNLVNGCYQPVGRSQFHTSEPRVRYVGFNNTFITWPGNSTEEPNCPSHICLQPSHEGWIFAVGVVACVTVIVIALLVLLLIRRRTVIMEMGRKDWIITSDKLFAAPAFTGGTFKKLVRRTGSDRALHGSNASHESLRTSGMGQIFARVTVLNQQLVAIKQIHKDSLELNVSIIREVNQVRRIKHSNVNYLVGACVDPGNICLLWGYCAKGSLRDVLINDNITLDWMFKLSFINDIARGMLYLHNNAMLVHGHLKSTNVVVDKNWSCKVTDFAMFSFREGENTDIEDDWQHYYNLLYKAPELLRLFQQPSRKGDVYAFGIMMHEIITRTHPFDLHPDDNPEIAVRRVMNEEKPPFRPLVPKFDTSDNFNKDADERVLDLMVMCWDEYPLLRLPFSTISHNLKKIRQAFGTTENLVDQMLVMVTKYADNLEELVEERTQQLQDEQKKTEELLCRMLPKSVAHNLKLGNPVIPESYKCITIFFSDIVGFTALAADSTPMQVVSLLNDLYTVFDNVVDKYDAYKIETIGDAYMVVSGLPDRNGDLHAGQIATVALEILTNVLSFRIRHCPGRQLFLRIGLHSGSAVAGVVGLKMPRYCLFGDTVNYASKMESTGKPLHIHVSPECKEYLDKLGGYQLQERGVIEIKGKGNISTYFLVGKEGFRMKTQPLSPEVRKLVGINVFE